MAIWTIARVLQTCSPPCSPNGLIARHVKWLSDVVSTARSVSAKPWQAQSSQVGLRPLQRGRGSAFGQRRPWSALGEPATGANVELAIHVREVGLDGLSGEEHPLGNLSIGQA